MTSPSASRVLRRNLSRSEPCSWTPSPEAELHWEPTPHPSRSPASSALNFQSNSLETLSAADSPIHSSKPHCSSQPPGWYLADWRLTVPPQRYSAAPQAHCSPRRPPEPNSAPVFPAIAHRSANSARISVPPGTRSPEVSEVVKDVS